MNLKTSNVKTKRETKFHVRYSLFSGKAFANFWKFWTLFATFGLRKKRKVKGGTPFCRYLNVVELLLHSYRVVLQILKIVWKLSLVLSIDSMENKHRRKKCWANSSWSGCDHIIFLENLKSCVGWLSIPMVNIGLFGMLIIDCWSGICNFST
jgi:hypothetical protein